MKLTELAEKFGISVDVLANEVGYTRVYLYKLVEKGFVPKCKDRLRYAILRLNQLNEGIYALEKEKANLGYKERLQTICELKERWGLND